MPTQRAILFTTLLFAAMLGGTTLSEAKTPMSNTAPSDTADMRIQSLLEWSKENKRGISIYLNGETIHGVVREILSDALILSNQERDTIIVRKDRINAIAGQ